MKVAGRKTKVSEPNPYETQIANRMKPAGSGDYPEGRSATGFPKVTFAA